MIPAVIAHNFKGATFKAPLKGLTLVVGPNGSGKSSRSQALQLAVLGYVPGAGGKQNAAILDAFKSQDGKDLRAGVVLENGTKLERRWQRSTKGTVSQDLHVGGIRVKPDEYARALADVALVDLSVFLGFSDAKKVDELFRLFPPEGNVRDIAAKIEAQAKRVNDLERQEREAMTAVATVLSRRSNIQLPAGTMADKQHEIEQAEADLKQARADLEAERIAAARAEEQVKAEARQAEQPATAKMAPLAQGGILDAPGYVVGESGPPEAPPRGMSPAQVIPDMAAILERILSTMGRTGCDVCAARMVIKQELAKARKGLPREAA
ncbi:MAG: ATP-binding protein [Desulfovibrio sp.]